MMFLSRHRNTRGSSEEKEMLWNNKLTAGKCFQNFFEFSNFHSNFHCKKRKQLVYFDHKNVESQILFACIIIMSTAWASSVHFFGLFCNSSWRYICTCIMIRMFHNIMLTQDSNNFIVVFVMSSCSSDSDSNSNFTT